MDEVELDDEASIACEEVDGWGVGLSAAGLGEGVSEEEFGVLEASAVVLEDDKLCSSVMDEEVLDSAGGGGGKGDGVVPGVVLGVVLGVVVVGSPSVVVKVVELSMEDVVELLELWSPSGLDAASRLAASG